MASGSSFPATMPLTPRPIIQYGEVDNAPPVDPYSEYTAPSAATATADSAPEPASDSAPPRSQGRRSRSRSPPRYRSPAVREGSYRRSPPPPPRRGPAAPLVITFHLNYSIISSTDQEARTGPEPKQCPRNLWIEYPHP